MAATARSALQRIGCFPVEFEGGKESRENWVNFLSGVHGISCQGVRGRRCSQNVQQSMVDLGKTQGTHWFWERDIACFHKAARTRSNGRLPRRGARGWVWFCSFSNRTSRSSVWQFLSALVTTCCVALPACFSICPFRRHGGEPAESSWVRKGVCRCAQSSAVAESAAH